MTTPNDRFRTRPHKDVLRHIEDALDADSHAKAVSIERHVLHHVLDIVRAADRLADADAKVDVQRERLRATNAERETVLRAEIERLTAERDDLLRVALYAMPLIGSLPMDMIPNRDAMWRLLAKHHEPTAKVQEILNAHLSPASQPISPDVADEET